MNTFWRASNERSRLALAVAKLRREGLLAGDHTGRPTLRPDPLGAPVAAVSVGIVDGEPRLDLPYVEDSAAAVDMNIVMTAEERLIEVQGTAEHGTFSRGDLNTLCDLAWRGIAQLCALQGRAVAAATDGEVTTTLP